MLLATWTLLIRKDLALTVGDESDPLVSRRQVIDPVRVDEANRLRHDKLTRKTIEQVRWLLLRNLQSLKAREHPVRQTAAGLLAGHRQSGSAADAYGVVGRNKQPKKGHQADGVRLPG
ncbi:hypothetical protein J2X87_004391 [Pseudomonas synxantha]|uniref:Uncharacterized protein n=1 Tax=Pseudomonas synxantha TaxID=47883 RepID=A0ACC6JRY6_9PSED|nr:hypothetical protein [Pseudomonas synxantha]